MARKTRITSGSAWGLSIFITMSISGALYGLVVFLGDKKMSEESGQDKKGDESHHVEEFLQEKGDPFDGDRSVFEADESPEKSHDSDKEEQTKHSSEEIETQDLKTDVAASKPNSKIKNHDSMQAHWTYTGEFGPTNWHTLSPNFTQCKSGQMQSPIAIESSEAKPGLEGLEFAYQMNELRFTNQNHTLLGNFKNAGYIAYRGHRYPLRAVTFHSPSEHALDSMKADMELQFMHSDKAGNEAILSIMVFVGDKTFGPIEKVFDHIPEKKMSEGPRVDFNPLAFLPKDHRYFSYRGSYTRPPCNEGIQWFVLKEPIYFSARQIDQFLAIFNRNARPIQVLGDRKVRLGGRRASTSH